MVIIGFGQIGAACGKLVKGFGTKVIGLKRNPQQITSNYSDCADEIKCIDEIDSVIGLADYVVAVLP